MAVLAALFVVGGYLQDRFRIGVDAQVSQCLPGTRVFLIDRYDRHPMRGVPFAFHARGLEPYFADGVIIAKVVEGIAGDSVRVTEEATEVNGRTVGKGLALAQALGRSSADFAREVIVPNDRFWFMGRTLDSFDSRYWGTVGADQLIGRVYRLF